MVRGVKSRRLNKVCWRSLALLGGGEDPDSDLPAIPRGRDSLAVWANAGFAPALDVGVGQLDDPLPAQHAEQLEGLPV